ncbi:MAG: hypothetical protein ACRDBY_00560 [Cetobacterium sp.]
MLDYRPNIKEHEREVVNESVNNNFKKEEIFNNVIENEKVFTNYENNQASRFLNNADSIILIEEYSPKFNLNKDEEDLFGDVLNFNSQNERLSSIKKEVKELRKTLSIMIYGKELSIDEAEENDKKIISKLKLEKKANNNNLFYLLKVLIIVNEYLELISKHIEGIELNNYQINNFFGDNEKELILSMEECDLIQNSSMRDLKEQIISTNFVSDNFIISSCMADFYNSLVEQNIALTALNKLNLSDFDSELLLYDKNNSTSKKLFDLITSIEYQKMQCSEYNSVLYSRLDLIQKFYKERV